jgi:hypothetical protein
MFDLLKIGEVTPSRNVNIDVYKASSAANNIRV